MKFLSVSALLALVPAIVFADSTVNLRVARDATVAFNGILCANDTIPCSSLRFGLDSKLLTFRGNRDYERVLLGFDLPTNKPKKCVLRIPKPLEKASENGYALTVSTTDSFWDEATVSGYTKKLDGAQVGSANVTSNDAVGTVDVTAVCANATNYKISLFVDTENSMITFNSLQSGSSDVFTLDYTF
ncbi:hypothetical protein LPJ53_003226 [Coemansia erecta]|uniref:Ubiquitin 3 binding protein But2 C-terminal domain-containing protein n=1 Tax=Coemansia erecta TaxID=147472 RepID=A0A9W7Y171_9FUNG|nr:hypothetical protein LPJ53_003226 [Coemansia erecta]